MEVRAAQGAVVDRRLPHFQRLDASLLFSFLFLMFRIVLFFFSQFRCEPVICTLGSPLPVFDALRCLLFLHTSYRSSDLSLSVCSGVHRPPRCIIKIVPFTAAVANQANCIATYPLQVHVPYSLTSILYSIVHRKTDRKSVV